MTILVNTTSRELVEPVVRAFAGQIKFVQTAPPPVPFCARVSDIPPHLCQLGDLSTTTAPLVDVRELGRDQAIEKIKELAGQKAPSILQMGKSALGDFIKWGSANFGRCSKEQIQKRLSECKRCPHWDREGFRGTGRCKKCGCSTWSKLKLKSASCPDGRWAEIPVEAEEKTGKL